MSRRTAVVAHSYQPTLRSPIRFEMAHSDWLLQYRNAAVDRIAVVADLRVEGTKVIAANAIALNRFGLGARPDEKTPANPRAWLTDQFNEFHASTPLFAELPSAAEIGSAYAPRRSAQKGIDREKRQKIARTRGRAARETFRAGVNARAAAALTTTAPFVERLIHFWSNHFAVSASGLMKSAFVPVFERDAIRPHVLGMFENMLLAVERHPAMLVYLDQAQSVGPQSSFAKRQAERDYRRKWGLNENLAREVLELHTLGVRSGYNQTDVTELARALTGWGVGGLAISRRSEPVGGFVFLPEVHEPGTRSIRGIVYPQAAERQGRSILSDLAHAPETARHVAFKLARHFVADDPPAALVDRLARVFIRSGGDLPSVYVALAGAQEVWSAPLAKFKTPWEWTISALRGTGRTSLEGLDIDRALQQLGQPTWRPGSPAGWDDVAAAWAAPDTLVRRVELAMRLAAQAVPGIDPRELARKLLPGTLSDSTAAHIASADSFETGLVLLLVSPEFQRR